MAAPQQSKIVLTFVGEPPRKMGLNKTNLSIMARAFGKQAAAWIGKTVTVEFDESVQYAGQLVGGLRVRIQRAAGTSPRTPSNMAPTVVDQDDDISFAFGANEGVRS